MKVLEFEVVNLGVEFPDYFQGFGVAFTSFDDCYYGIGSNPAEALDDCLEGIAMAGTVDVVDLEARVIAQEGTPPTSPIAPDGAFYHVGIRWTV